MTGKHDLTPAEREYMESCGANIEGVLTENGRAVADDGSIGFVTIDGRIVARDRFANGFCIGDVVTLRSGGQRMTVSGAKTAGLYRQVGCQWFDGSKLVEGSFEPSALGVTTDAPHADRSPAGEITWLDPVPKSSAPGWPFLIGVFLLSVVVGATVTGVVIHYFG